MNLRVKKLNLDIFTCAPQVKFSPSPYHHPRGRGKLLIALSSILSKIFLSPVERKPETEISLQKKLSEKLR